MSLAPPETRVGHVPSRWPTSTAPSPSTAKVLGFTLKSRYGLAAAFLAAGSHHHHIGLNTWTSLGAMPPPPGHTGLHHTTFLDPDRRSLAQALRRALDAGVTITGKADHGVSEAIHLKDPDGNGVETCRDRPEADWPRHPDGTPAGLNGPLDLEHLLAEA